MPQQHSETEKELATLLQLGASWAAVTRVWEGSLRGTDVGLSQALAVLQIAAAQQPLLLNQLALRLVQQPQSVTSLMDRVEQAGWARRVHDLPDRRAIRVEITAAGTAKAAEIGVRLLAAGARVLAGMDETARGGLTESLMALYAVCRTQSGLRLPELPRGDGAAATTGSE